MCVMSVIFTILFTNHNVQYLNTGARAYERLLVLYRVHGVSLDDLAFAAVQHSLKHHEVINLRL